MAFKVLLPVCKKCSYFVVTVNDLELARAKEHYINTAAAATTTNSNDHWLFLLLCLIKGMEWDLALTNFKSNLVYLN